MAMEEVVKNTTLTASSPGFVKNYFAASRLHHLSTWKSDLIDFVAKYLAENEKTKQPSHPSDPYRIIMHVDMDCFFASVGMRDRPHLKGKPVAVAHSTGGIHLDYSSSEIASCNYEARNRGAKNGMFIGSVKKLAPDLVIIPYEFEKYDACSKAIYEILLREADYVQAVSCDEAYIDITQYIKAQLRKEGFQLSTHSGKKRKAFDFLEEEEEEDEIEEEERAGNHNSKDQLLQQRLRSLSLAFAEKIRQEIFSQTQGCAASVGISHNLLLARIATQKAKPNNVYFLSPSEVLPLLNPLPIKSLPGFGSAIVEKCQQSLQLKTCEDVRKCSLSRLKQEVGEKTAESLARFVQGLDDRILENKARQSIGSDINWGMRFKEIEELQRFLKEFVEEVYERLQKNDYVAGHVTVNMKKKLYEGEPGKFLGCGHCQDYSKSMVCQPVVKCAEQLLALVAQLVQEMNIPVQEIRGIGIHLKKLVRIRSDGSEVHLSEGGGGVGGKTGSLWKWTTSTGSSSGSSIISASSTVSSSITSQTSQNPSSNHSFPSQSITNHLEKEKEKELISSYPLKRKGTIMTYLQPSHSLSLTDQQKGEKDKDPQISPVKRSEAIDITSSSSPELLLLEESEHSNLSVRSLNGSNNPPSLTGTRATSNLQSISATKKASSSATSNSRNPSSSSIRNFFSASTIIPSRKAESARSNREFLKSRGVDLDWFLSLPEDIQSEQLELLKHSR